MNVIVLPQLVTTARVDAALLGHGFARAADFPFESGIHEIHYRLGEGKVMVIVGSQEGATAVRLDGVEAAVVEAISRALEGEEPPALIAALRAATEPRAAIRAIGRLAMIFYAPDHPLFDEALDTVLARLTDPHPIVRWAACKVTPGTSRKVEAALAAVKDRYPEFGDPWASVREACQRKEDGTLGDTPTKDVFELERRAKEGAEKKQWKRVELATEAWLAERPDSDEAAYHRAIAYRGLGEPLLALAWIAGAVWRLRISAEVERNMVTENPTSTVDPARKEAMLARWQEEMTAILAEARAVPDPEQSAGKLVETFESWAARKKSHSIGDGSLGTAAEALAGLVPSLEPLLRWLRVSSNTGATDEDRTAILREAEDSPWVWRDRAMHTAEDDFIASVGAWEEARRLLSAGPPQSALAVQIARLQELAGESLTEDAILESMMRAAYDRRDWDDAAARADLLVQRDPDSVLAWQIRANARTFGLRHEEAVPAYDDALRELSRVIEEGNNSYLNDPRSALEFNRACVLAKLGRRDEALEGLRRAVKHDEKWAGRAAEDDYFEALWQDPEFLALVRGDAAARLLAEEKTPAHVIALLNQANHAIANLDATRAAAIAEQALAVAGLLDSAILRVTAGMIAGYVTVVKGNVDEGVRLAKEARAELDSIPNAEAPWRAEQLGEYVTALLAAQRWDDAEAACRDAMAARVEAFGQVSLPVVLSYNQLALIEVGREAPLAERTATLDRAESLLAELLAKTPEDPEVHAQRASFAIWRAELTEDAAACTALMESAADGLEKAAQLGGLRLQHIDKALTTVEQIEATGELRGRVSAVHERLTTLLFPDPAVRAERLFWRRIRQEVRALRRIGHDDAAIGNALADLIRGDEPDMVRELGVFKGFAEHMARHTASYSMLALMAPMALQTALANGNVLEAIDQIEGLVLSGNSDEDEYDSADGDGEDEDEYEDEDDE